MLQIATRLGLAVAIFLSGLDLSTRAASAQATPPDLGPTVLADRLTGPGIVGGGTCPTGRNSLGFAVEGFLMRVAGRCTSDSDSAGVTRRLEGLNLPDGEIQLELAAPRGDERARFRIFLRDQAEQAGYYVAFEPANGVVQLVRWERAEAILLAERRDLSDLVSPDSWNRLAVRLNGPTFWLIVNDQVVLTASDRTYVDGPVLVDLLRTGDPDDQFETSVVLRNLFVSPLAETAADRAPTVRTVAAPPTAVPVATPAATPAVVGTPGGPRVGRIYFSRSSDAGERATTDVQQFQTNAVLFVYYDFFDLPPGSILHHAWLLNGSTQGAPQGSPPLVPSSPTGWISTGVNVAGLAGRLTLVVDLNGREVARRDLQLLQP